MNNKDMKDENRPSIKEIKDVIEDIRKSRIRERDKLDKTLLTISAGTIVFSATFVADLIKSQVLIYLNLLFLSWLSLAVALICILLGYITVDWHFENLERTLFNYNNIYKKITDKLNIASFLLTILGIVLLVIFVFININHINVLNIK